MKFLFVIPKNKFTFFGFQGICPTYPHLGIAYLIANLQKHGHDVKLFDDGGGRPRSSLTKLIRAFNPDMIGITSYSFSTVMAYELIEYLKNKTKIPIVLGGVHVSTIKGNILKETRGNFAIKYEGEYALVELLEEFKKKKPNFEKIDNLIYRKGRKIIENKDRALDDDLDKLPFPQFDLFDIPVHQGHGEKLVPLVTSRGCPYGCNFCTVKLYMGRCFRKRSPENVFEEIKYQYEKGYHQFDFNDDCFSVDRPRAHKILDLIIESGMNIRFQFYNGLRVDSVDPELLAKMKRAGCIYISYGCESGNPEILKKIKKGITLEQVRKATTWTKEAGIASSVNMIIGHKDETWETAMDSINFAKSLPTNFVNFYNLVPYPGTEAYDWVEKNGKFLVDTKNYLKEISYIQGRPIFETSILPAKQRNELLSIGSRIHESKMFIYRFGPIIGRLIYLLTRNNQVKIWGARLSTSSTIGKRIAFQLSRKSYHQKSNQAK